MKAKRRKTGFDDGEPGVVDRGHRVKMVTAVGRKIFVPGQ